MEKENRFYTDITFQEFWELYEACRYPYPNITDSLGGVRKLAFLVQDELMDLILEFQPEVVHTWITKKENVN